MGHCKGCPALPPKEPGNLRTHSTPAQTPLRGCPISCAFGAREGCPSCPVSQVALHGILNTTIPAPQTTHVGTAALGCPSSEARPIRHLSGWKTGCSRGVELLVDGKGHLRRLRQTIRVGPCDRDGVASGRRSTCACYTQRCALWRHACSVAGHNREAVCS